MKAGCCQRHVSHKSPLGHPSTGWGMGRWICCLEANINNTAVLKSIVAVLESNIDLLGFCMVVLKYIAPVLTSNMDLLGNPSMHSVWLYLIYYCCTKA